MSRKWERMIQKNTKLTNKSRVRSGQTTIGAAEKKVNNDSRFTGKNYIFPCFLIGFAVLYLISFAGVYKDIIYWVTVLSYIFLALIIYFFRKPFLTVGKSTISTKRFSGIKHATADQIESITLSSGYAVISLKGQRIKWTYSKLLNRFDTEAMAVKLKEFAAMHSINLVDETR